MYDHELVKVSTLKPHPKNYRQHPEDQLKHIIRSIEENGMYRNIVIADDGTILAGHGVYQACCKMGLKEIPVVRLPIDPNCKQALKVITGDNEVSHLGVVDDRLLSELLKEIATPVAVNLDEYTEAQDIDVTAPGAPSVAQEEALEGTGYDGRMLANLAMVTRPASEIKDFDAAAHWAGLPEFTPRLEKPRVIVSFLCEEDRVKFGELIGIPLNSDYTSTPSVTWPPKIKDDRRSLRSE